MQKKLFKIEPELNKVFPERVIEELFNTLKYNHKNQHIPIAGIAVSAEEIDDLLEHKRSDIILNNLKRFFSILTIQAILTDYDTRTLEESEKLSERLKNYYRKYSLPNLTSMIMDFKKSANADFSESSLSNLLNQIDQDRLAGFVVDLIENKLSRNLLTNILNGRKHIDPDKRQVLNSLLSLMAIYYKTTTLKTFIEDMDTLKDILYWIDYTFATYRSAHDLLKQATSPMTIYNRLRAKLGAPDKYQQ